MLEFTTFLVWTFIRLNFSSLPIRTLLRMFKSNYPSSIYEKVQLQEIIISCDQIGIKILMITQKRYFSKATTLNAKYNCLLNFFV